MCNVSDDYISILYYIIFEEDEEKKTVKYEINERF